MVRRTCATAPTTSPTASSEWAAAAWPPMPPTSKRATPWAACWMPTRQDPGKSRAGSRPGSPAVALCGGEVNEAGDGLSSLQAPSCSLSVGVAHISCRARSSSSATASSRAARGAFAAGCTPSFRATRKATRCAFPAVGRLRLHLFPAHCPLTSASRRVLARLPPARCRTCDHASLDRPPSEHASHHGVSHSGPAAPAPPPRAGHAAGQLQPAAQPHPAPAGGHGVGHAQPRRRHRALLQLPNRHQVNLQRPVHGARHHSVRWPGRRRGGLLRPGLGRARVPRDPGHAGPGRRLGGRGAAGHGPLQLRGRPGLRLGAALGRRQAVRWGASG
jgi:hypothetical protein